MSVETPANNLAGYQIRKWYTQIEEVLTNETGKPSEDQPLRKVIIAAAIKNPHAGEYCEDLSTIVDRSDELGAEFGRRAVAALGTDAVQSYGKACLVGMDGEYEHGNAFLTQFAADPIRKAIGGGKAWVPSTGRVGAPGSAIDVPLAHKDALYVRSHYDSINASFGDAPRRDEVIIIWAFATRGRLHARLGGIDVADIKGEDGLQ
jgi:hypothetical protein